MCTRILSLVNIVIMPKIFHISIHDSHANIIHSVSFAEEGHWSFNFLKLFINNKSFLFNKPFSILVPDLQVDLQSVNIQGCLPTQHSCCSLQDIADTIKLSFLKMIGARLYTCTTKKVRKCTRGFD